MLLILSYRYLGNGKTAGFFQLRFVTCHYFLLGKHVENFTSSQNIFRICWAAIDPNIVFFFENFFANK